MAPLIKINLLWAGVCVFLMILTFCYNMAALPDTGCGDIPKPIVGPNSVQYEIMPAPQYEILLNSWKECKEHLTK